MFRENGCIIHSWPKRRGEDTLRCLAKSSQDNPQLRLRVEPRPNCVPMYYKSRDVTYLTQIHVRSQRSKEVTKNRKTAAPVHLKTNTAGLPISPSSRPAPRPTRPSERSFPPSPGGGSGRWEQGRRSTPSGRRRSRPATRAHPSRRSGSSRQPSALK